MTKFKVGGVIAATGLAAAMMTMLSGCDGRERVDPEVTRARGQYLVEKVGMCADCHSARGPGGMFDLGQWLQGAPLGFSPTVPMPAWAGYAPGIAGLHNYTDAQAIALLTEGKTLNGQPLRPPMPAYRFNREDAEAIVVYLRSLN
ncbi:c-type cytochrome [Rariglobus hedericola]|nr:c-type cytochrome [Rariglobus hedericola]